MADPVSDHSLPTERTITALQMMKAGGYNSDERLIKKLCYYNDYLCTQPYNDAVLFS